MATRPPDFKSSGIRVERIIASGSSSNPRLLLIGSGAAGNDGVSVDTSNLKLFGTGSDTWLFISGSVGGTDRVTFGGDVYISGSLLGVSIGGGGSGNWNELSPSPRLNTTASVALAGSLGSSYAAQSAGSDVYFFVSGSSTNAYSLFGGQVVTSGSILIKDSSGATNVTISPNGNATFAGDVTINGGDITTSAANTTIFPGATSIAIGAGASSFTIAGSSASTTHTFGVAPNRTGATTLNLGTGATSTGNVKEVKIGLGGDAGSTTNIRIGTTDAPGTTNIFVSGSMQMTGSVDIRGSIVPNADFTYNLGTPTLRWQNVYTGDLHLRNSRGDWTILEEEEYLCVINNKTGKRYKMMLQPLD